MQINDRHFAHMGFSKVNIFGPSRAAAPRLCPRERLSRLRASPIEEALPLAIEVVLRCCIAHLTVDLANDR